MDSFFGELIKLGAAGLIIWVICAPLIKYMIDSSKEKDKRINQLVDTHLAQDAERHGKTIATLERVEHNMGQVEKVLTAMPEALKTSLLSEVQKIYPPMPTDRGPVTVNVAGAGPAQQTSPSPAK